ncbi:MAG: MFS transporter [Pseudomonadota bacterium]
MRIGNGEAMPALDPSKQSAFGGIMGAIACTTIFALTIGLTYPLLSFVLERAGYSETAIGINAAMTPIGIVVASPFYPRIIRRFGAWQVAATCLAASGTLVLAMSLTEIYALLLVLRFLLGIVDVGVYIVSEAWINQLADPKTRGRTVGLYATALAAGFGLGPLLLSVTGSEGFLPFAIGAGACYLAIFAVLAIRHATPGFSDKKETSSWSFIRLAPALLVAIIAYAFWEASMLSLFPVYGLESGLEARFISIALSVSILGNTFLQIPLGWVADLTSRRGTMIFCACMGVLGVMALPHVVHSPALLLPTLFIWGAVAGGLYTMAMTELGDRFEGADLVAGNAAFAIAFGFGGIVGGPLTGVAMEFVGRDGFSWVLASAFAFTAIFSFWRRKTSNG